MRRTREISAPSAAIILIWLLYSIFIFIQSLSVPPLIWQDSRSYAAVAEDSLFSTAFWAGTLPPISPLVIRFAGASTTYIIVQSSIAVVSWGLLVLGVCGHLRKGPVRIVAALLIFGFACSNPITLWNNSVLSETLDLSFLVLIIAGLLIMSTSITKTRVLLVTLVGLLFAETRDTSIITVAVITLGLGFLYLGVRHRPNGNYFHALLPACSSVCEASSPRRCSHAATRFVAIRRTGALVSEFRRSIPGRPYRSVKCCVGSAAYSNRHPESQPE